MKKFTLLVVTTVVALIVVLAQPVHADENYPPASDHTVCQELPYGTPDNPCGFEAATRETWTVLRGQTLWRIAVLHYGNGRMWRAIAAENGIRNPRRVRAGRVLILPS